MISNTLTNENNCTFLDVYATKAHVYSYLTSTEMDGVTSKNLYAKASKNVHRCVQIINKLYAKRPKTYTPKTMLKQLFYKDLTNAKHPFEPVR